MVLRIKEILRAESSAAPKREKAISYSWTSGLVTQAQRGTSYGLRVVIEDGDFRLDAWYSPRHARWIMSHLTAAGNCSPDLPHAYKISLAGPTHFQPLGHFGYFDRHKLGGLLWGLRSHHVKQRRAAARELAWQQYKTADAGCLALLTNTKPKSHNLLQQA